MYVYYADSETIDKYLVENKNVIVGIFQERCEISNLFIGMLRQLRKVINRYDIIVMITKEEYQKRFEDLKYKVMPRIDVYQNQKIRLSLEGFKNYKQVYDLICA